MDYTKTTQTDFHYTFHQLFYRKTMKRKIDLSVIACLTDRQTHTHKNKMRGRKVCRKRLEESNVITFHRS